MVPESATSTVIDAACREAPLARVPVGAGIVVVVVVAGEPGFCPFTHVGGHTVDVGPQLGGHILEVFVGGANVNVTGPFGR